MEMNEEVVYATVKEMVSKSFDIQNTCKSILFYENKDFRLPNSDEATVYSIYLYEMVFLPKYKKLLKKGVIILEIKTLFAFYETELYLHFFGFLEKDLFLKNITVDPNKGLMSNLLSNILNDKDILWYFLFLKICNDDEIIEKQTKWEKETNLIKDGIEYTSEKQIKTDSDGCTFDNPFELFDLIKKFLEEISYIEFIIKNKKNNDVKRVNGVKPKISFKDYENQIAAIDGLPITSEKITELYGYINGFIKTNIITNIENYLDSYIEPTKNIEFIEIDNPNQKL